jgi:hypothetical protein
MHFVTPFETLESSESLLPPIQVYREKHSHNDTDLLGATSTPRSIENLSGVIFIESIRSRRGITVQISSPVGLVLRGRFRVEPLLQLFAGVVA